MADGNGLKKKLRYDYLEKRLSLSEKEVMEKSEKIMSHLFELEDFKKAGLVMFYVDCRNEVMTKKAIEKALAMGKRVAVPKTVKGEGLLAIEIKSTDELACGTFGILEPVNNSIVNPFEIDLVLVPGIAFDRRGYRLGYGAGYYDMFLPRLRKGVKKIGLAFEMQLADCIPAEAHDVRMDAVLTEKGLYVFS
ncbi:5-formyltetrahydrofolate cyclo-ligase [Fervidicola ferrireducens]|uniref:5-formyltetrahydrofolate cyclo-ligase n=1 Tax=Fervidicola ferrireducens TaxID=520764 RepID=A0A140LD04_9FIRM|nr:5-formyltetrahydrofolate cyclo-ligase [Fervidicola ferrireducens]KXG78429.1 5-formyltetrahydrofolate cyclo-ligase [Fervidicola ferrireducens]